MIPDELEVVVPVRRSRPKLVDCYLPRATEKRIAGYVQAGEILAWVAEPPFEWRRMASESEIAGVREQAALAQAGDHVGVTRGGRALEAIAAGVPYLAGGRLHVLSVHVAQHPRRSLEVAGDILVVGDLAEGIEIRSGGDVLVDGSLHGATVTASGDIEITGMARLHATVRAGGRVAVRSAEASALLADGGIRVAGDTAFCRLETAGKLEVAGKILGGHAKSGRGIHAAAIGSPRATPTRVTLAPQDRALPDLRAAESRLNHAKERLQQLLDAKALPGATEAGNRGGGGAKQPEESRERRLLEEVRASLKDFLLARRRASLRPVPQVEVDQAIHAGVAISAGTAILSVERMLPPCRVFPSGGHLEIAREEWPDRVAV